MVEKEKPLEWIASSYKDLMALPPDVRRRFGYALSLAQMGDQDDAAKVLKGLGGAGGRRRRYRRHVSSGLHDQVRGSSVRPALLPEEEQE
jgi:phage-related protein